MTLGVADTAPIKGLPSYRVQRKAAKNVWTFQALQRMLHFPEGSVLYAAEVDQKRGIISFYFTDSDLEEVLEGQEVPEVIFEAQAQLMGHQS